MIPTEYAEFLAESEEGLKGLKLPCQLLKKVIKKLKLPPMKEI